MTAAGSSGGDRHALEVARCLWKYGYEVFLAIPSHSYKCLKRDLRFSKANINLCKIDVPAPRARYLPDLLGYFLYVIRGIVFIRRLNRQFDLIYCPAHLLEILLMGVIAKNRNPNAKLCVWVHHLVPSPKERARYKSGFLFERFVDISSYLLQEISILLLRKYGDVILTPTKHVKGKIVERVRSVKVEQVDNGVDLRYIGATRAEGEEFDGCSMSTAPRKGAFDLVRAWGLVVKKIKDAKLVFIGPTGKWGDAIQQLVSKLNLDENILLTGYINEHEKIKRLKGSKLFICPSYEEGWSIAMSEAAACSLPIIAYENPIFRDVYGDSILYVPRGNSTKLVKLILFVLRNPKVAAEYSRRSKEWAATHDWEEIARKEACIFSSLLS